MHPFPPLPLTPLPSSPLSPIPFHSLPPTSLPPLLHTPFLSLPPTTLPFPFPPLPPTPPHLLFSVPIQEFESSNPPRCQATAEDLIRSTKGITLASVKAVSAGNSCRQLDITACANLAQKTVTKLLETCKAAAYKAQNGELKSK